MDKPVAKDPLSLRERDRVRGLKHMKSLARVLRRQATDAECLFWSLSHLPVLRGTWTSLFQWKHLRDRRLMGFKFRRQVVIEPYIVDFVCLETKLIIEADGGQHAEQIEDDVMRTARLEAMGYRVMRFWNHEILTELHSVLEQIQLALIEAPSPQPSPGGRGS